MTATTNLHPADLAVTTYPPRTGGQQRGMSGGVRIEHIPSGLVAIVTINRSQHRNRAVAMDMILGGLTSPHFR